MKCEECGEQTNWSVQSSITEKWIGPCCIMEQQWSQYPGWKEREEKKLRKAEQARMNFAKARTAVVGGNLK